MSSNISSLVGYGLSSDTDSDEEGDEGNIKQMSEDGVGDGDRTIKGRAEEREARNFLLESGSGSSESDSESEPEGQDSLVTPAAEPPRVVAKAPTVPSDSRSVTHKLPPPPLGACGLSVGGLPSGSSVFANPFRERAEEHLNVLRKHVPLTLEPRPSQIGGRKMCISYRRDGRCRFGISCKFAHDSDLQTSDGRGHGLENEGGGNRRGNLATSHRVLDCPQNATFLSQPGLDQDPDPEPGPGKKRRVGLSNTLIPPKRALKQFATQRERERVTPS